MPFITEDLWQDIVQRKEGETIMYAPTPKAKAFDPAVLEAFSRDMEAVNGVRSVRNQKNIAPKEQLEVYVKGGIFTASELAIINKMGNVQAKLCDEIPQNVDGVSYMVGTTPIHVAIAMNAQEELAKAQKELAYLTGFLQGVRAKLSNEKFTAHAPAQVIENERKKEADALSKIESLEAKIAQLSK